MANWSASRQLVFLIVYTLFARFVYLFTVSPIDHFTVVCSVTWPLDGSEAGVDLVLIQTSLLLYNQKHDFHFFRSMYNKTFIRIGFCDFQNNQGLDLGKGYQPQPLSSVDNPYLDLDYSGYHRNLIQ